LTAARGTLQEYFPSPFPTLIRQEYFLGGNRMGRTKQGNRNAQANTNAKRGNRTSSEMVEFTTGRAKAEKNRPQD
jgi:hypothetical protein